MFEQWWKEHGHRYTMPITAAEDAYLAGQQAQRGVITDAQKTLARIKLLIENTVDDSEELPMDILDIVNAAIYQGEQG